MLEADIPEHGYRMGRNFTQVLKPEIKPAKKGFMSDVNISVKGQTDYMENNWFIDFYRTGENIVVVDGCVSIPIIQQTTPGVVTIRVIKLHELCEWNGISEESVLKSLKKDSIEFFLKTKKKN
jgi:hypothetical protein